MHIVEVNRQVVLTSLDAVRRVRPSDLALPTPCAGWSVADLLAHMSVQHRGFAAAARGETAGWKPVRVADPVAEYLRATADVLEAFADAGGSMLLPEIVDTPVPTELAVGFHLVDYVVHTWDLAAAIGAPVSFDDEILEAALGIARQVPDGEVRTQPGAAFAPAHPVTPGADALEEILALLGREADWARTI